MEIETMSLAPRDNRQLAVFRWTAETFGLAALTIGERALRVLEEAVELAQAAGIDHAQVRTLVDHVFAKPPGALKQEAGGVGLCLLAFAEACKFSADEAESAEFERVLQLDPGHFRMRHNKKADAGIAVHVRAPEHR
jgi:hypothetical protein